MTSRAIIVDGKPGRLTVLLVMDEEMRRHLFADARAKFEQKYDEYLKDEGPEPSFDEIEKYFDSLSKKVKL